MAASDRYVPPLSLLGVLEDLIQSGDPDQEIEDVLVSLAQSDRGEIAEALIRYAADERLSVDDRHLVGEALVEVWTRRNALSWKVFDSLAGPARAGARIHLPVDLALREAGRLLEAALEAEVYDRQGVEDCLWAIRRLSGPQRDQLLTDLASDGRLSGDHRRLVASFVDYTRRYRAAPGDIKAD